MDTILVIIGAIVAIVCIVAIYYLLKLILGYVGFAIIGAVVFGVIGAVAANYLFPANMIDITLYSAGAGAVLGLVLGILNTMDFLKTEPCMPRTVRWSRRRRHAPPQTRRSRSAACSCCAAT